MFRPQKHLIVQEFEFYDGIAKSIVRIGKAAQIGVKMRQFGARARENNIDIGFKKRLDSRRLQ